MRGLKVKLLLVRRIHLQTVNREEVEEKLLIVGRIHLQTYDREELERLTDRLKEDKRRGWIP